MYNIYLGLLICFISNFFAPFSIVFSNTLIVISMFTILSGVKQYKDNKYYNITARCLIALTVFDVFQLVYNFSLQWSDEFEQVATVTKAVLFYVVLYFVAVFVREQAKDYAIELGDKLVSAVKAFAGFAVLCVLFFIGWIAGVFPLGLVGLFVLLFFVIYIKMIVFLFKISKKEKEYNNCVEEKVDVAEKIDEIE